jgi:4-aminobutyrate aminotransferase-like enzyme
MEPTLVNGLHSGPRVSTELPGPKSRALLAQEAPSLAPGMQSIATLSGIAIERAQGCELEDADGNRFLDLAA